MAADFSLAVDRPEPGRGRAVPPALAQTASHAAEPVCPSAADAVEDAAHHFIWRNNVRDMTPRQMSVFCGELYLATMISCDEYLMMAFQPELHGDYNRTIGALIGEPADPDRPRDYVRRWAARLDFEVTYNAGDRGQIARTRNILAVLRRLDAVRCHLGQTMRVQRAGVSLPYHD